MVVLYKDTYQGYKICYDAQRVIEDGKEYIKVVEPHSLSRFDASIVCYSPDEVTILEERPVMLILRKVHGAEIVHREWADRWEEIIGYEVMEE